MIVENQSNLKVHFAGVEDIYQFGCCNCAEIKYTLLTAFPFICDKIGIKTILMCGGVKKDIPKIVSQLSKHTILDSGLFTLMFGSHKGIKDEKFIEKWYEMLTDFILQSGFNGTCVEVDCQKVLGSEKAWELRQRMSKKIPNRIINVFHKEDGAKGLQRMIEYSDYIAISVPELRFTGQKDYVERLVNHIKNRKPKIDIHLLGCTETNLLSRLNFCSSSDSTSWKSVLRYGNIELVKGKKKYKDINEVEILKKYSPKIIKFVNSYKLKPITKKGLINYSTLSFQAEQLKTKYSHAAGDQN